jgi:hypothetical protein
MPTRDNHMLDNHVSNPTLDNLDAIPIRDILYTDNIHL